jgi:hypothetical protein
MLLYLQQDIKQDLGVLINKSDGRDFSFLTSKTKYFLTNSATNTAAL